MIQAAYFDMRYPGQAFYGTALSGAGAVENLQASLSALAQITGWADVNPGGYVAGIVGEQTLSAVVAAVKRGVLDKITDTRAKIAIQTGLLLGLGSEMARAYARTLVSSYAPQLDVAVRALAMDMSGQKSPPATNNTTTRDLTPLDARSSISYQDVKSALTTSKATATTEAKPWYKDTKVLVPVAAGVGALGIAAFFLLR